MRLLTVVASLIEGGQLDGSTAEPTLTCDVALGSRKKTVDPAAMDLPVPMTLLPSHKIRRLHVALGRGRVGAMTASRAHLVKVLQVKDIAYDINVAFPF